MPRRRATTDLTTSQLQAAVTEGRPFRMRELSAEQRGVILNYVRSNLTSVVREIDGLWLHVGMFWSFIVKNKLYRYWGEHIRTVNDLVRDLDLGVSRSTLDHYARIFNMFGKYLPEGRLTPPLSKLLLVHPVLEGREFESEEEKEAEVTTWLHKVDTLPVDALRDEVREARGLVTTDQCGHPAENSQLWSRCGCCGKWLELLPRIEEEVRKIRVAPEVKPQRQQRGPAGSSAWLDEQLSNDLARRQQQAYNEWMRYRHVQQQQAAGTAAPQTISTATRTAAIYSSQVQNPNQFQSSAHMPQPAQEPQPDPRSPGSPSGRGVTGGRTPSELVDWILNAVREDR